MYIEQANRFKIKGSFTLCDGPLLITAQKGDNFIIHYLNKLLKYSYCVDMTSFKEHEHLYPMANVA